MRTVTATYASRGFSDLLDAVERGETVQVTRAGRVIAEIHPATPTTGRSLRDALSLAPRLDDDFASDVAAATSMLTAESDPWHAG